jgi:hypothetical protein
MSWTGLVMCTRKMRLTKMLYSEYLKGDSVIDKTVISKYVLKENLESCGIHSDGSS